MKTFENLRFKKCWVANFLSQCNDLSENIRNIVDNVEAMSCFRNGYMVYVTFVLMLRVATE